MPEVEMREEGNQLQVCVDLPGLTKDNVKVDVEDGALVVQGERHEERSEGGEQQGFRRSERRYGSFYRAIPLPEHVDAEKAQAQMKDGVLRVTFPLSEQRKGRRLEISS
jgi:HSP20 family protein